MIEAQEVIDWSGLRNLNVFDDHLALIVPAVNQFVDALPSIDRNADGTWGATTRLGAVMLATRLYQRKNSPAGVESVGDAGVTYIARYDNDIARLLKIDSFREPMVG